MSSNQENIFIQPKGLKRRISIMSNTRTPLKRKRDSLSTLSCTSQLDVSIEFDLEVENSKKSKKTTIPKRLVKKIKKSIKPKNLVHRIKRSRSSITIIETLTPVNAPSKSSLPKRILSKSESVVNDVIFWEEDIPKCNSVKSLFL